MNPSFKFIQLALLFSAPLSKVVAFDEAEFVVDASPSMIRGGNVGMDEYSHHGRELSFAGSWSWTNLLCKFKEINTSVCLFHQKSYLDVFDFSKQFILEFATHIRIARSTRIRDHAGARIVPSRIHPTFKVIIVKTHPLVLKVTRQLMGIRHVLMVRKIATERAK
jgi:hypothetical protein